MKWRESLWSGVGGGQYGVEGTQWSGGGNCGIEVVIGGVTVEWGLIVRRRQKPQELITGFLDDQNTGTTNQKVHFFVLRGTGYCPKFYC